MGQDLLFKEAASLIKQADALLICAGAGMGVDSGLPDFRGDKGFWQAYPPYAKLNLGFMDLANPQWFFQKPELAWGFYGHRLNLYRNTTPHQGFANLLNWIVKGNKQYFVFTSNVDGQFQKAGFDENKIEECHGSINYLQCTNSACSEIWSAADVVIKVNHQSMEAVSTLPRCINCGDLARPNILMFGDWNWISTRTNDQHDRFWKWLEQVNQSRVSIVECGAGTAVPTVRLTAEKVESRLNATLIRINSREADVQPGQISIEMGALEALTEIHRYL